MRYGQTFKLLLGGRHLIVVGSAETIQNVFTAEHGALTSRTQGYDLLRVIGADFSLQSKLFAIATEELFPIVDKRLSKRALGDLTPGFAEVLFNRLRQVTNGCHQMSLRRSLTEPLYVATNAILLGDRFSSDTYNDFLTFNNSIPSRLPVLPSCLFPSNRARSRLLQYMYKYLEDVDSTNYDDKLGANFVDVFQRHNLTNKEGASLLLAFMLVVYINTFDAVFWLITRLLTDPPALAAVSDEINRTVREEFGGLQGFLANASPENLQSPSFALLHSAVLETLRLSTLLTGLRDAERDIDVKDGERVISIRKGEHVIALTWAAHRDERLYPDGHRFIVDRFVQHNDRESMAQMPGKAYFPFGGGRTLVSLLIYRCACLVTMASLFTVQRQVVGSLRNQSVGHHISFAL